MAVDVGLRKEEESEMSEDASVGNSPENVDS